MAAMQADDVELKRLKWRAHHRGVKEADQMVGGFFDMHSASWGPEDRALFTALLEEQDVDIMAWAIGTQPVPARYQGGLMQAMQRLDYLPFAR